MEQERKVDIETISHRRPCRSLKQKRQHQSNRMIHVTVGLLKNRWLTNRKSNILEQKIGSSITQRNENGRVTNQSSISEDYNGKRNFKSKSLLTRSAKVSPQQSQIHCSSDRIGIIEDHHRKNETNKKCSRRCIIISLVVIIIIVSIIIAILLAILLQTQSKTSTITTPVLRWNSTGITVAGITANPGNANDQLNSPLDVIFDHANNMYIVDYMNQRIQKYLFGTSVKTTVFGNGTSGLTQYQLNDPWRTIIDSNNNLYIADTAAHRILFLSNDATSATTIAGIPGICGNASNQFCYPSGIALDSTTDTLYIVDYNNHRMMSYASGTNSGNLLLGGIGGGISNTQLYYPTGLHFDSYSNSLIITNYAANNIVRYVLGENHWTLVAGNINGSSGDTSTHLFLPIAATLDPMGNIYVADRQNHRIQFFYNGQFNGTTIAGISGVNSSNATTLNWPSSIRLDSQLNVYVADTLNHRIQKFSRY